ncbi:MAG: nitroreductase family protein [Lautropia sp.]
MSQDAHGGGESAAAPVANFDLAQALEAVVSSRRSVYSYLDKPVPRHLVEDAVRHALQAPNHHRSQPLRLFAFAGDGLESLADAYEAAGGRLGRDTRQARARGTEAPVMIVAACLPQTSNPKVKPKEEEFACAAAIENLLLSLASNGLSSLITTGDLPESPEVHRLVGVDPGEGRVVAVVEVGYMNPARRLPARVVPGVSSCLQWRDGR